MDGLLHIALSAAVPLWIAKLQGRSFAHIQERAHECAQIIAEKGDVILYRSKKTGETARAFNALAEGIACLSFAPGGVKTMGMHFETQHFYKKLQDNDEKKAGITPWFDELAKALDGIT